MSLLTRSIRYPFADRTFHSLMNTPNAAASTSLTLQRVDRVGVAASVICAIHCALAPILLLALPAFGRIWAHPGSHILIALLVVPLAAFSIRKGYRSHRKRWILVSASIGTFFIVIGAILPAFSKAGGIGEPVASTATGSNAAEVAHCADQCCPSFQIQETGRASLHIPPAAIVTTLGGIFLIAAHIGNLCSCGHSCRTCECPS